jgi:hypothetical protein
MKDMKCFNMSSLLVSVAMLLVGLPAVAGSRDDAVANVSVYVSTADGRTAYTYTIENTGTKPILGFSVGFDHYTGTVELSGDHPVEVVSPHLWESRIVTLEASPYYQIRWDRTAGVGGLAPGRVVTGFTIVMDNENPQLLDSHWTAIIAGPPTYASSKLVILDEPPTDLDVTPPVISVEVEPGVLWPPNKKMIEIKANVTVSDDTDPGPIISLESISCNECDSSDDIRNAEIGTEDYEFSVRASRTGKAKPGRVYTVVYSATDSSGNRSQDSAKIVVPHDQRK